MLAITPAQRTPFSIVICPTHENLEGRLVTAFRRLSVNDQARLVDDIEAMADQTTAPLGDIGI